MSEVSTGPELSAVEVAALAKRGDTVSQRRFVGVHILLLLGGVLMVFPFVYQILMSLSTNMEIQSVPPKFIPDRWQFHNYTEVFTRLPFLKQFGVSVTITVLRTVVQLILCSMGGYAFARMKFGGKSVLFGLVLAILMVPVVKPGLFAVMITTVLWSWNDLLWPLIVTTREQSMPLSVGIATLAGQHSSEFALMMAASVMAMAPIFLLFFSMQRKVIEGLASSGLKG